VAPNLPDTIGRTAFGGTVLVVVSPEGVATVDLGSDAREPLGTSAMPLGTSLHGAAVVPCP
jgi:hypothetical protein